MNPVDALAAVGRAIGDGLTLAAEVLCPRDHTAEDRLRSWESAAVAVEGEICDEADACEATDEAFSIEDLFELRNRRYADSLQSSWRFVPDSSAAVSAAADPSPTVPNAHSVVGDEGSGGASDILQSAPPERLQCAVFYRTTGFQSVMCTKPLGHSGDHGSDPGEVTAPSPGEQVREDDLAAHILASAGYRRYDLTRAADAAARSLLTDFNITRK
ncbi:hypothetical protein [Mycolicibacterium peregrinum]|uniref:hypothetical protein n=1 Tax=Mycolicibacterium peregrinum TaxID=43304 RepID=UPI003AAEDE8C